MNVLFILEHYHPYIGGAETLFRDLAEALAAKGQQVSVLTSRFDRDLPLKETHNGVEIIRVNCKNRFLFSFLSLPKALRYAKRADVVHTTTYNAALPAWLAAKLRRKPVVVTFHEVWSKLWLRLPYLSWFSARLYYSFERLLLNLPFDRYVAVSKFTEHALINKGIPARKIHQIYNGLDYDKFKDYQHQPPDQFTYCYFGRLGVSKGLNLLLPAAAAFKQDYPDSRLVLIIPKRPKAMYDRILQLISDLSLEQHVQLLHELEEEELYKTISQSSAVVIPSYSEGFCFVAAESCAMGVPIISSAQGALKEVVTGPYLEMEEMSAEAISKCLSLAYEGQFEQRKKKDFNLATAMKAYLKLYKAE